MATIVPRWEWRTFGDRFGPSEAVFADMTPIGSTNSEELYLLAPDGANVKVRDDLLDIKVLEEVDSDGLERWMPVMKAPFPMSNTEVTQVLDSLGLPESSASGDTYSLQGFLDEFVEPSSAVRVVRVRKDRTRYAIDGCMSELTDVVIDGRSTRTIAVESEDKRAVLAAVHVLGLRGYANINYPRGLTRAIDDSPDRFAVIDVGTNSVKFNLGERANNGSWTTLTDRADVTRLGEGLDKHGAIQPDALERTAQAINAMAEEAKRNDVLAVVAVGTAGLRAAGNQEDVIETIRERTGISVEVISGEEESRLAYLAVQTELGLGDRSLVVFDTGGGSSQFTFGTGSHVDDRFSVEVGAVRYTEHFGLSGIVSGETLQAAFTVISTDLSDIDGRPRANALVGMGGAITNIAAVSHEMATYDPDVVQGTILKRSEVDRQIDLYRSLDTESRRKVVGLQPKRAEVILAGACIVRTVMDLLHQDDLTVSDRGLRHGVAIERFGAAGTA